MKEDPENEHLLYVGTDNGVYVSLNSGTSWEVFRKNIPHVAVHDLVIQPTAKHLIIGTHGRSLYKADIAPLQKMTEDVLVKKAHIFAVKDIRKNSSWGRSWSPWRKANTPELKIPFYSNSTQKMNIAVFKDAVKVNTMKVLADKGYNEVIFDVSFSKKGKRTFEKKNPKGDALKAAKNGIFYLPKGKYVVKIGDEARAFEVK